VTKVDRLTVVWPSGRSQQWDGGRLAVDRYHRLHEPAAEGQGAKQDR
jgi:hypothetical protein